MSLRTFGTASRIPALAGDITLCGGESPVVNGIKRDCGVGSCMVTELNEIGGLQAKVIDSHRQLKASSKYSVANDEPPTGHRNPEHGDREDQVHYLVHEGQHSSPSDYPTVSDCNRHYGLWRSEVKRGHSGASRRRFGTKDPV